MYMVKIVGVLSFLVGQREQPDAELLGLACIQHGITTPCFMHPGYSPNGTVYSSKLEQKWRKLPVGNPC